MLGATSSSASAADGRGPPTTGLVARFPPRCKFLARSSGPWRGPMATIKLWLFRVHRVPKGGAAVRALHAAATVRGVRGETAAGADEGGGTAVSGNGRGPLEAQRTVASALPPAGESPATTAAASGERSGGGTDAGDHGDADTDNKHAGYRAGDQADDGGGRGASEPTQRRRSGRDRASAGTAGGSGVLDAYKRMRGSREIREGRIGVIGLPHRGPEGTWRRRAPR
jgi:hypothetical protein